MSISHYPLWDSRASRKTLAAYDGSTTVEVVEGAAFWPQTSAVNDSFEASGTVTSSGSAEFTIAFVVGVSGGLVASGVADFSSSTGNINPSFTGSGTATSSGSASFSFGLAFVPSGTVIASASASFNESLVYLMSGTSTASGSVTFSKTLTLSMTGVLLSGGGASFGVSLVVTTSGTAITSGAADFSSATGAVNDSFTMSGTIVSSGSSSFYLSGNFTSSGTTVTGGSSAFSFNLVKDASGGSALSGTSGFSFAVSYTPDSGAILGGVASFSDSLPVVVAGSGAVGYIQYYKINETKFDFVHIQQVNQVGHTILFEESAQSFDFRRPLDFIVPDRVRKPLPVPVLVRSGFDYCSSKQSSQNIEIDEMLVSNYDTVFGCGSQYVAVDLDMDRQLIVLSLVERLSEHGILK